MATFSAASLGTIEEMVIQTGEPMLVYGVGPLKISDGQPIEDLKNSFLFYTNKADAQNAYDALVDKGTSTGAVEIRFSLNGEGYLQADHIKNLESVNE